MSESELESLQCRPFHLPESEQERVESAEEKLVRQKLEELTGVSWEVKEVSESFESYYFCKCRDGFKFRTSPFERARWLKEGELLRFAAMVAVRWEQQKSKVL